MNYWNKSLVGARAGAKWETRPGVRKTESNARVADALRAKVALILANRGVEVSEPAFGEL